MATRMASGAGFEKGILNFASTLGIKQIIKGRNQTWFSTSLDKVRHPGSGGDPRRVYLSEGADSCQ